MQPGNRLAYIDSVRAVAALLVVITHGAELFVNAAPEVSSRWLYDISHTADFGRIGVVAFFCISGFVIPSSFSRGDPNALRKFAIRRFFRLYPIFWLSIPAGLLTVWKVSAFTPDISPQELAANITMLPEILGARPVMGLYWTLSYELAFYGLCIALWLSGKMESTWTWPILLYVALIAAAGLLLALPLIKAFDPGVYVVIAMNFAAFFLGAWWRRLADGRCVRWERWVLAAAIAGIFLALPLACGALIFLFGVTNKFFIWLPSVYGAGLGTFLLMTSIAKVGWRPLAWIGLVSYALYLFHPTVLYPMVAFMKSRDLVSVDVAATTAAFAVASIALSAALYYVVERPAINLGRRLTRPDHLDARPSLDADPA